MSFRSNLGKPVAGPGEGMWAAVSHHGDLGGDGTYESTIGLFSTEEAVDAFLDAYEEKLKEGEAHDRNAYDFNYFRKKWMPLGPVDGVVELYNIYYTETSRNREDTERGMENHTFATVKLEYIEQKIAEGDEALLLAWQNKDKAVLIPEQDSSWQKTSFSDTFLDVPEEKVYDSYYDEWYEDTAYEKFVSFSPNAVILVKNEGTK